MERNVKAITSFSAALKVFDFEALLLVIMVHYSQNSLSVHTIKGDLSLATRSNRRGIVDYATERACGIVSLAELAVVKS